MSKELYFLPLLCKALYFLNDNSWKTADFCLSVTLPSRVQCKLLYFILELLYFPTNEKHYDFVIT